MDKESTYRIVHVHNDPIWGTFYKIQYKHQGLFRKKWKDWWFYPSRNAEKEFRISSYENALYWLDLCKKSNANEDAWYDEVVYEE